MYIYIYNIYIYGGKVKKMSQTINQYHSVSSQIGHLQTYDPFQDQHAVRLFLPLSCSSKPQQSSRREYLQCSQLLHP